MRIYAVDIETACNVPDCKGYGVWQKCAHALDAHRGQITQIGIWSPEHKQVFKDVQDFRDFVKDNRGEGFAVIGQNFKFDLKFLIQNNCDISDLWVGDTQLLGSLYEPKIPDSWLADYEVKRHALLKQGAEDLRKGSKHSLKTMAPYYLGVDPFWEVLGTESDEYVLKDCEYTYQLYEYFLQRLPSFDPYSFYENYMFPAEKFLLGVEQRGVTLDLAQLEADREAALKEIKTIERKLKDIWVDAFGKWDDEQKIKLKDKYEKMIETQLLKKKSPIWMERQKSDSATRNSTRPPQAS